MAIARYSPATMPNPTRSLLQGYTMSIKAGDTVYTAGQVGQGIDTKTSGGADIEAQIRQTWRNLQGALEVAGGSLKDVVRTTTFVTDIASLATWYQVWNNLYKPEERPASTFVEIPQLARAGLMVEIEAIGVLGGGIQRINPDTMSHDRGYSGVVKAGDTVYVAGQASIDRDAHIVAPGDVKEQVRQTWRNIEAGMKSVGGTLKDIVKVSTFATDIGAVTTWYEVWNELFPKREERPASTFVEVPRLARPGLMVEIEAVGYLGKDVEVINPPTLATMGISHAVRAGNTVYASGQVSLDKDGKIVGHGDIQTQLAQVWHNLGEVMKAAGGSANSIVKVTDYVTEIVTLSNFYASWNEVFSPEMRPTSSFIEVPRLARPGLMVEIEAIGVLE